MLHVTRNPIIWQSFAAIGQGSSGISRLNVKKQLPPIFLARTLFKCTDSQSFVSKFQGDWPTHLGDVALQTAWKKETSAAKRTTAMVSRAA